VHLDEVLFSDDGLHHETEVVCRGVAVTLAYDLAGILDRKLDLQVLVPVGVYLEFSLPDPFGVVSVDARDFQIGGDVELLQSGPD
jgi:hypothetical protein